MTERTFSWYSEQPENCQGEVEHLKTQVAQSDADRLVKQAEVERLQKRIDVEAHDTLEEIHRLREENERLRAALEQIADYHPDSSEPTCAIIARQALEEK